MNYQVKSSWLLKKFYPSSLVWKMPKEEEPSIYLSFDDGPHPEITRFVLEQLEQYKAKASFFCIGKNVEQHAATYYSILAQGHVVGNHTNNHANGWKTSTEAYIQEVKEAAKLIDSRIFRPPYGRIKRTQLSVLLQTNPPWKIYMWDVLSGDFDTRISPEKCLQNVINNIEQGSIVVFHDSEKAFKRLKFVLPGVLEFCAEKKWQLKSLPL